MDAIKRMPITITGLVLGLAALGNLLQSYSETLRLILGGLAAILFVMVLIKLIAFPNVLKETMENPLLAGVFTTYPMALNLLSTYAKPFNAGLGKILWIISVLGIIAIMLYVGVKYLAQRDLSKVFPSFYIVYSGIAVASITAPAFEMEALGKIFFWLALVGYIAMTPLVFKRVFVLKNIPDPGKPANAIITAPLSLCIAGYNSSFAGSQNLVLLLAMVIWAQAVYFYVVTTIPTIFKGKFMPSFAGYTFPIVISAIALKTTNGFLAKAGMGIPALAYVVKFEELVATVVMTYLFVLFMKASFSAPKEG